MLAADGSCEWMHTRGSRPGTCVAWSTTCEREVGAASVDGRMASPPPRPGGRSRRPSVPGSGSAIPRTTTEPERETVDHIPFGAYPTELVRALGGWNGSLRANEDFELDYRIRRSVIKLLFDPAVRIQWETRESIRDLFRQYRRYGRGKAEVARLHPQSLEPRHLAAPGLVLALVGASLIAPWRPVVAIAAVDSLRRCVGGLPARSSTKRERDLRSGLWLPLAFLAMHLGWGRGFWEGLIRHSPSHSWKRVIPFQRAPEVTVEDVAEVVSRSTGIPVSQLTQEERDRLLKLEERLHERVVGQDEPVVAVAEAVRRGRAGLGDPKRPVGSFLFLGPTGVGKTELARTLAEVLFGGDELIIRFDMSEFQERHTVSRLVGAPPGYVGYEEAGQLTEAVRRKPYSVVLLDEIEKAHPDVFNLLLQILDDGRLTDAQGRTVDFKNTVVIMTSNLGAERIQAHARRNEDFEELKEDLMQLLRSHFPARVPQPDRRDHRVPGAHQGAGHPDRRAAPGPGDPSDVAEELRAVWSRYDVRDLLCSESDWSWLLLQLSEDGLPIVKVPRSPQRLALQWQQFYDAVLEKRLSHDGERTLARHVSNLSLISGPSGPRPHLDVAEGQPIAAALGVMVAYDGAVRTEPAAELRVILPSLA